MPDKNAKEMTYTYGDIITAKDVLTGHVKKGDIIGKKGWLLDCIPQDMSLNMIGKLGFYGCLDDIHLDDACPFTSSEMPYTYFLPEKESAPNKLEDFLHLTPDQFDFLLKQWTMNPSQTSNIKAWTSKAGRYIAVDNTAGELYVEEFDTREETTRWLKGTGTKEEMNEPEYVPFDFSREEDRQLLRDKWLIRKSTGSEYKIAAFRNIKGAWEAHIPSYGKVYSSLLLEAFTFLDGSPAGKLSSN